MAKRKRRRGECVYCSEVRPLTRDHVPPRNLFGAAPPDNLITVPCCTVCNGRASKDDEYFRRAFVLRHDVSENPRAANAYAAAMRALQNPAQRGFTRSFLQGIRERAVYTLTLH